MANSKCDLVDVELKEQLNESLSTSVVPSKKEPTPKTTTCCVFVIATVLLIIGGIVAALYTIFLDHKIKNLGEEYINKEEDLCLLPIKVGDCHKTHQRWSFDGNTCRKFTYKGCKGNRNNFITKEKCLRACAGSGGLPLACNTLHDKPLSTEDVSEIFGTSSILERIAPPLHTGTLRSEGALPTGHFASNAIHNNPAPIRLIPYSAIMNEDGITYDAYTLERWNASTRSDTFHQLTPGKKDNPWIKLDSLGTGMKQMVSGPDSNPFSKFTGLSGVQVGIANTNHPEMTSFEEMYANFLYTSSDGGTLELPLVRGAAMLTHIFTQANPILTPHCLVAVNGQDVSLGCPEEESSEDTGSGFVEAYCSSAEETLYLTLHMTKPIEEVTDVQWGASRIDMWYTDAEMITCNNAICKLSDDKMMVEMAIPNYNGGNMVYSINVLDRYMIPSNDYYGYWITNPMHVTCDNKTERQLNIGTRMPNNWFYGSASVSASCGRTTLEINVTSKNVFGGLEEIQFLHGNKSEWHNKRIWEKCTKNTCQLSYDRRRVTYTATVSTNTHVYAVNVIGQYVVQPIPFNWKRSPFEVVCESSRNSSQEPPLEISSNSFILELAEPLGDPKLNTRKFAAFFSEKMTMTIKGGKAFFNSKSENFTGIMQLAFAGTGKKGDFEAVKQLEHHVGIYSYKPRTRTCVLGDTGYISWDWNTHVFQYLQNRQEPQLLIVTLPHHEVLLEKDALIPTIFGFKGYTSDLWVMEEPLVRAEMDPDPQEVKKIKENSTMLQDIIDGIARDAANHTLDKDCKREGAQSYWAGKSIGMVSRLASISRAFGTNHYTKLDESLRRCLDLWLGIVEGITEANVFRYDSIWGGMFLYSNRKYEPIYYWTNFGFVSYSNHHIHLGYWIYGIAYYAKHHMEWAARNDTYERITAIVRDVANPSKNDTFFPTVRHKDWYMGHSWATGIGGGTRLTESTSEAINCYHAVAALGHALGDVTMQNIGRLMLATEIRSTREYWHVRAHNKHIFPPIIQNFGVLGQMQEDGIFYYTLSWPCNPDQFPERHACIVGLQILPITSVSKHYMDQEWARNIEDVCSWAINPTTAPGANLIDLSLYTLEPVSTQWAVFCYAITSQIDNISKLEAINYMKSIYSARLEAGTGFASTLLFIYGST
ncbi:uncharacterized protein [Antedon mediterranea]|uniref:uncharacterized protein n=1 Tax=Antedon mediterranea TaxID=105859 RepID=UPI003AF8FB29